MPNQQKGKYAGQDYYGSTYTGAQPSPPQMTLGQLMNMDVAGFSDTAPYSGAIPNKSAGSPQSFNFTQDPSMLIQQPTQTVASSGGGGGGMGMLGIGNVALGGLQTLGGLYGLLTTKEPEKYSLTGNNQQAINESKTQAKFGLSPVQLAAYNTNVRQAANTDIYNAKNMAGDSLSRAVFGVRRGQTLGALNNLAVSDFNAQQQKVRYRDQMFGIEQGMKDRNTALDWNQYGQKMQAYGGALRSGLNNMAGFFNLGEALKYSSLIG